MDVTDENDLEAIIDRYGLSLVLATIATICCLKADHLRATWQDEKGAKAWERDGLKVAGLGCKVTD